MGFSGDGGPPPPPKTGGGRKYDPAYGFTEKVTRLVTKDGKSEKKPFQNRIKTWYVPVGGRDKPLLMLDPKGDRYIILLHDFVGPDGKKGSMVRCISKSESRGCPICTALGKEGVWYWCLTAIDQSKWIPNEGKNKGKVYTNNRKLVLVTSQQYDDMQRLEEKEPSGWRGRTFDVTRSNDSKSYKIGTQWYPTNAGSPLTDEQMHAELAEAAATYGMSVVEFCKPINYELVLKRPSFEEAVKIAQALEGSSQDGGGDQDDQGEGDSSEIPTSDTEAVEY